MTTSNKKQENQLTSLINSARLKIAVEKIKNTSDLEEFLGFKFDVDIPLKVCFQYPKKLTVKEFNEKFLPYYEALIVKQKLENPNSDTTRNELQLAPQVVESPVVEKDSPPKVAAGPEEKTLKVNEYKIFPIIGEGTGVSLQPEEPPPRFDPPVLWTPPPSIPLEESPPPEKIEVPRDFGVKERCPLPDYSPKQKCFLFNFQKNPTRTLFENIYNHKIKGQYLIAATGAGKTVIYLQVLRWLHDRGFFKDEHTPWPMLIVTAAPVVEQTKLVAEMKFGFDCIEDGLEVTNFEQLRSNFGKKFLRTETIVRDGEPYITYKWHNLLTPKVIIVDEAHKTKNNSSAQSQIFQKLAQVKGDIFVIFVSATPIMRVSDAKAFVLNCHLEYDPTKM